MSSRSETHRSSPGLHGRVRRIDPPVGLLAVPGMFVGQSVSASGSGPTARRPLVHWVAWIVLAVALLVTGSGRP